jgi:hypothetical protein
MSDPQEPSNDIPSTLGPSEPAGNLQYQQKTQEHGQMAGITNAETGSVVPMTADTIVDWSDPMWDLFKDIAEFEFKPQSVLF